MESDKFRYLVVGAGFFGAVIAERIANDLGEKVLVIDKRNHIGGNCYSEVDAATGIEFHKYGTHILHTSNPVVWEYINRFTQFNGYRHQVLTTWQGKVYQMPINLETINSFYNLNLKPFEVEEFLKKEIRNEPYPAPKSFEEVAISMVGRPLYEAFIKGYTLKQWQKDPKEMPASILRRLPFRKNYNESYYESKWQGIPEDGFTAIFEKMLGHPNIEVRLNTDYFDIKDNFGPKTKVIYSGPIDRYFNFKHGRLTWRTLDFEFETIGVEDYQGNSVMNYAEQNIPFTRIHEPRHLHPERERVYPKDKTLIIREYSKFDTGNNPYYPVTDERNQQMVLNYRAEAQNIPNLIIAGRLGDFRYYDMHETIARALEVYEKDIKQGKKP